MGRDLGGVKFDQGKAPLSMLPRVALEQEAKVMEFGAKKYGKFNYRKGMKWSRLIDAALRHVYAFADGEDEDPETHLSHLAHARCCLGFLLEYADDNLGEDDRLPDEKAILVVDTSKYNPAVGRYTISGIPDLTDPTWANQSKLPPAQSTYYQCNSGCDADCQDCEVGDASGYCGNTSSISRTELPDLTGGKSATQSEASRGPAQAASSLADVSYTRAGGTGYGPYSEGLKRTGIF